MLTRFLPTRVHGIVDYVTGSILAASPWLLNYEEEGAETWLPVALGAGALGYSLLTNYELGVSKTIPMDTHLKLDMASGALLMASPWLFGFAKRVWLPHVLFGAFEIMASLTTQKVAND